SVVAARDVRQDVAGGVVDRAVDRLRVRVDQQLRRVEAPALLGCVGTVDPVRVTRARTGAGDVAVPVERGPLRHPDALLAAAVLAVEAQLDALGVFREEREIRALAVPDRTEWERTTGPGFHQLISALTFAKSATSSVSPRRTLAVLLAHEEERHVRAEEHTRRGDAQELGRQPVAEGAVSDLVVVLRTDDEPLHGLLLECAREIGDGAEALVVALALAGQQHV